MTTIRSSADTARAERDLATLRTVAVVTNVLGYRRGEVWVLPGARTEGDRRLDVEIRFTRPVHAAIRVAVSPIMFRELAVRIAGSVPADVDTAERLLASLVQEGALRSAMRWGGSWGRS